MKFICCSVISEGGQDDIAGYSFSQEGTVSADSGADTHILSVQPKATFNSITNRSRFVLESIDFVVTGNFPISWKLVIGQALSGTTTFIEENATYSAFEYNILGTLSGSPAITIAQGFIASTASSKQSSSTRVPFKYPITLDAAGTARTMGRLTAIVQGVGGASATRCVFNWKEIR